MSILAVVWAVASGAMAADSPVRALKELSLDQLPDMHVTSVTKRSEPRSDAAASIYVITQLHDRHPEYGGAAVRSEYERNVFGQVRWQL